jgi:hypothetical protein
MYPTILISAVVLVVCVLVLAAASRRKKDAIYLQYKQAMKDALKERPEQSSEGEGARMVA